MTNLALFLLSFPERYGVASARRIHSQMTKPIEQRMEEFVAGFGDVPPQARKLEDYEARHHQDIWIQRLVGEGIACNYVIGYQLDEDWWTFCFDRRNDGREGDDEEFWIVEAYDSQGESWRRSFLYRHSDGQWRPAPSLVQHDGGRAREDSLSH